MTKASVSIGACATALWAATAMAAPTSQQLCNSARINAWAKYQSCVTGLVADEAKDVIHAR